MALNLLKRRLVKFAPQSVIRLRDIVSVSRSLILGYPTEYLKRLKEKETSDVYFGDWPLIKRLVHAIAITSFCMGAMAPSLVAGSWLFGP